MPLPRLPSISASRSISRKIPSFNADFTSSKKRNKKRKGASSCLIMRYLSLDEVYFDVYKGYKGEDKKRSSSARGDAIIEFATNSNEFRFARNFYDVRYSLVYSSFILPPFLEGTGFTHPRSGRIYHVERILTSPASPHLFSTSDKSGMTIDQKQVNQPVAQVARNKQK